MTERQPVTAVWQNGLKGEIESFTIFSRNSLLYFTGIDN
jgi:hypothetical protein